MPDLGPSAECNLCGVKAAWASVSDGKKQLPEGWTQVTGTFAGDAQFCSLEHEEGWKRTREWRQPDEFTSLVVTEPAKPTFPCPHGCEERSFPTWSALQGHIGAKHSGRKPHKPTYKRQRNGRVTTVVLPIHTAASLATEASEGQAEPVGA